MHLELEKEKLKLENFRLDIKEYKKRLESFHLKRMDYSIDYSLFYYLFLRLLERLYELKNCDFDQFIQFKSIIDGFNILKRLKVNFNSVPGSFKEYHRRLIDSIDMHYKKTIIPTFLELKKGKDLRSLQKLMDNFQFKEFGHLLDYTTTDFKKKFNFHFKHGKETNKPEYYFDYIYKEYIQNQPMVESFDLDNPLDEYKKSLFSILIKKLNNDLAISNSNEFIDLILKTIEFQPKIQFDLLNELDIGKWKEHEIEIGKHQLNVETENSTIILFTILNQIKQKSKYLNIDNLEIFTGAYYSIVLYYREQLQVKVNEYKNTFFTVNQTKEKYKKLGIISSIYESIKQIIDAIEQDTLDQVYITLSFERKTNFDYLIDQHSEFQSELLDLITSEFYTEIVNSSLIFDMEYKGIVSRDFVIILQTIKSLKELSDDNDIWMLVMQKYDLYVFDNVILKRYDMEGARQLEIDLTQFQVLGKIPKSMVALQVLLKPLDEKVSLIDSGIEGLSRNEVKKILSLFVLE
ncbi:hypothetical protein HDV04_003485 [Boothiomyces sp. JEL0838]|nr:hypothetical protein HDV04_003485 [Boothiomyces sp. JEL0838]